MTYQIADEPIPPDSLKSLVCRPSAPLLAAMVCGAWLAWPWFAFNAIALGSPTKRRELIACAAGALGSAVLAIAILVLVRVGVIESRLALEVALLGVTTWKLGVAQYVCKLQSRTFEVYTFYGGGVRSPRLVLTAGMYLRTLVLGLIDHPVWIIIVAGGL
jgi:hypothetical protein